jgi:hypothetical protein
MLAAAAARAAEQPGKFAALDEVEPGREAHLVAQGQGIDRPGQPQVGLRAAGRGVVHPADRR